MAFKKAKVGKLRNDWVTIGTPATLPKPGVPVWLVERKSGRVELGTLRITKKMEHMHPDDDSKVTKREWLCGMVLRSWSACTHWKYAEIPEPPKKEE